MDHSSVPTASPLPLPRWLEVAENSQDTQTPTCNSGETTGLEVQPRSPLSDS